MKTYKIVLRDSDDHNISDSEAEGIKAAKETARHMLSDNWATASETTHEDLGTAKADILSESGELVEEIFRT
jgi:hypothetical protein